MLFCNYREEIKGRIHVISISLSLINRALFYLYLPVLTCADVKVIIKKIRKWTRTHFGEELNEIYREIH